MELKLSPKLAVLIFIVGLVGGVIGYAATTYVAKIALIVSKPPADVMCKNTEINVAPYETKEFTTYDSVEIASVKQYSDCVEYEVSLKCENAYGKLLLWFGTAAIPGPAGELGKVWVDPSKPSRIKICTHEQFHIFIIGGTIKSTDKNGYIEIHITPKALP